MSENGGIFLTMEYVVSYGCGENLSWKITILQASYYQLIVNIMGNYDSNFYPFPPHCISWFEFGLILLMEDFDLREGNVILDFQLFVEIGHYRWVHKFSSGFSDGSPVDSEIIGTDICMTLKCFPTGHLIVKREKKVFIWFRNKNQAYDYVIRIYRTNEYRWTLYAFIYESLRETQQFCSILSENA